MNARTTSALQRAQLAAHQLSSIEAIQAISVLGSVARGKEGQSSDVDLLVLANKSMRVSALYERLPEALDRERISIVARTLNTFQEACESGVPFSIHARLEGRTLFDRDGKLAAIFESTQSVEPNSDLTYRWARHDLTRYDDLGPFNGFYSFALSRLFGLGRAIVIARSLELGTPTFGKTAPFELIRARQPGLAQSIDRTLELRPFHERAKGRPIADLPFDHHGAHERTRKAVKDVRNLLPH